MIRVAFVVGDYPPVERKRREDAALAFATNEIEVGIVSVASKHYAHGLGPAEIVAGSPLFVEAFREAERQGYDAVVPLGTLDLGVEGGRAAVDIPVIAPLEAMLHVASLLGDRFGLIWYSAASIPWMRPMIERYGMAGKIAAQGASGFKLPDIAANRDAMVEAFLSCARSMIENDGVEVILVTGITQCPVHMKPDWLAEQLGVPVVEGIGAPIRVAAMLASLGLRHSRRRWPRSANFPPLPKA